MQSRCEQLNGTLARPSVWIDTDSYNFIKYVVSAPASETTYDTNSKALAMVFRTLFRE